MIICFGDEDPPLSGLLNYVDAEYSFGFDWQRRMRSRV
jgi:hypothetical protein